MGTLPVTNENLTEKLKYDISVVRKIINKYNNSREITSFIISETYSNMKCQHARVLARGIKGPLVYISL